MGFCRIPIPPKCWFTKWLRVKPEFVAQWANKWQEMHISKTPQLCFVDIIYYFVLVRLNLPLYLYLNQLKERKNEKLHLKWPF